MKGDISDALKQQLNLLTDSGAFSVANLIQLLEGEKLKMTSNTLQISDRVLRLATAYKRALYEMMRGSVDASNRMTVRDLAVPVALGVQKPTKE